MRRFLSTAVVGLGLLGCDKDSAKSEVDASPAAAVATNASAATPTGATSSATPAASASAAAAPPKCPAGLTGNALPAYCIKLPASYAVKEARTALKRGSISYDTGTTTDSLMVSYDEASIADQSKDVEGEMKFGGDKLLKKGDLPGGNKWFLGSHQDFDRVVTLLKGPGTLTLKCSFTYKPKSAPSKDAIDACRSIVLP